MRVPLPMANPYPRPLESLDQDLVCTRMQNLRVIYTRLVSHMVDIHDRTALLNGYGMWFGNALFFPITAWLDKQLYPVLPIKNGNFSSLMYPLVISNS